jgi:hypothetical protein
VGAPPGGAVGPVRGGGFVCVKTTLILNEIWAQFWCALCLVEL